MSKNDQYQARRAEQLKERAPRLSSKEQNCRTTKQHAHWQQRDQRFK